MATYFAGAAQVSFTNPSIVLDREDQLGDVIIAPSVGRFALEANDSEFPVGYIQTGVNITLDISVVDMSRKFDLLALAFGGSKVTNGGNTKYVFTDRAGEGIGSFEIIIKPYVNNAATPDRNQWVTFHNAVVAEIPDTSLAYGLRTQQVIRYRFQAMRDPSTGNKVTVGNTTI